MQLYSEQGISSYNLGCGSQSLASSYWLAKQAIRQHKPKLIVLDCVFSYLDTAYLSDEHLHYVTDVLSYPENSSLSMRSFRKIRDQITFSNWRFITIVFRP